VLLLLATPLPLMLVAALPPDLWKVDRECVKTLSLPWSFEAEDLDNSS
jgi:hypothetical protein